MVDPHHAASGGRNEADWYALVREAERAGEAFRAFDIARRGLDEHPDSTTLKHRAVLALARSGATRQARQWFASLGLEGRSERGLRELDARLDKDLALASTDEAERLALLRTAAAKYEAAYLERGDYYPGINFANLLLLAGEPERAAAVARRLIASLETAADKAEGEDRFWSLATLIEAHVINGDLVSAEARLDAARGASNGDYTMLATAARSIKHATRAKGLPLQWVASLAPPSVIHYTGHMIAAPGVSGRFPAAAEATIAAAIGEALDQHGAGFGYGSLASGADILFAEALLARGAQLHVVLPFILDDFIETSVRPAGEQWVTRMRRCLAAARSVRYATDGAGLGDDTLFTYSSRIAMGLAVLASQHLCTNVAQLAVWDGTPARGVAGTAVDVGLWRESGRPQSIIPLPAAGNAPPDRHESEAAPPGDERRNRRRARAMLFGDFTRFSTISDREMPQFFHGVLGGVARAIETHRSRVLSINTWGDGMFLVFRRTREAAECALDLQVAMQALAADRGTFAEPLALRLGGHLGPVFETEDPLLLKQNFFGAHVSLAARIEPVTPPGLVYVTETFAAALELEHADEFCCDYVGLTAAAKGYGTMRMFALRRRSAATDSPVHAVAI
jgi:class 3 adenylate cyclase